MSRTSKVRWCVVAAALWAVAGCSARKPAAPPPRDTPTPVPTVAPRTASPTEGTAAPAGGTVTPLPTRPVENVEAEKNAKKAGKDVGPIVTFAGIARADGVLLEPKGTKNGVPVFESFAGSGFLLVVEAKPGVGNAEVGRRINAYEEGNPTSRPDLEVEVNRDLGDGSPVVCDRSRPNIGGIPAINPPSFAETQKVSDAINDFGCRFEIFLESNSSCLVEKSGDFSFARPDTQTQFCAQIARAWNFPIGDTLVSVRVRDVNGNPGPVSKFWLRRPERIPQSKQAAPTPVPTPSRRRP